ncbi:MAG: hypothetical protein PHY43_07170 [Verrucomicrobiales bacterium]|nr:hypothetical protein [Verrucomicrobiales bacterium]
MLPSFPKAQKILDEQRNKQMFAAKAKIFPHHIHPPVQPIIEGKQTDFQREDRKIKPLKIEPHRFTISIDTSSGKGLTLEVFNQKATELGEGMGKQMFQMLLGTIEEAVAETGNEVKVKKGDLKKEDILRLFEMGTHNFDEHGNPTGQFLCGSEFAQELTKHKDEWEQDKEFVAKVEEIKRRKKEEFNEREARRRLAD